MIICNNCGNQIQENLANCPYCGAPVAQAPAQYTPQPNYNGAPQGPFRTRVKTDYSLLIYILLSFITCGIYGMYIIHKLACDTNEMCAEDGQKVGGLLAYILLNFVTCGIYSLYWIYKIQDRLHANAPRYGAMVGESGGTVLLWMIVGSLLCGIGPLVAYHIVFKSANTVGMHYNRMYFGM